VVLFESDVAVFALPFLVVVWIGAAVFVASLLRTVFSR